MNHPVYIVSRGRWANNPTAALLSSGGVPFKLVVEPAEQSDYSAAWGAENVLGLPWNWTDGYDTAGDPTVRGLGPGPARNFIWEHAIKSGASHHWCLDDNITKFSIMERNRVRPARPDVVFNMIERFVRQYSNIAQACPAQAMGVRLSAKFGSMQPLLLNGAAYACVLNNNSTPFRYRGVYGEDADLTLRLLKAGWCTVAFQHLACDKAATMSMKGGNTDTIYADGGKSLQPFHTWRKHQDMITIGYRQNRKVARISYHTIKRNKLQRRA